MPAIKQPPTKYVVLTSDNCPIFAVFSVERGEFATVEAAMTLANELSQAGESCKVERREWVPFRDRKSEGYRETRALVAEVPDVERAEIARIWREAHGYGLNVELIASDKQWAFYAALLRATSPRKAS